MIFSEIYGSYFKAVSAILGLAVNGELTGQELTRAVQENAFGESLLTIPAKLTDGSWPLLRPDHSTPLSHAPAMPLTDVQKQWLKALLADPRITLFDPSDKGLEDVEPLFTPEQFVFYDRYSDGDPFTDGEYIHNFRIVLTAIREHRKIRVRFRSGKGNRQSWVIAPQKLEYSPKDDKFRINCIAPKGYTQTVNMARIKKVTPLDPCTGTEPLPMRYRMKTLIVELTDERNALERCMLHFSNLEKETEKLDGKHYRMTIHYDQEDETELLIRILSFGPVLKVVEPESFVKLIRERIARQIAFDIK